MTPYLSRDVSAYEEHVGVNRHEGGSMGEMSALYPRTSNIADLRGNVETAVRQVAAEDLKTPSPSASVRRGMPHPRR